MQNSTCQIQVNMMSAIHDLLTCVRIAYRLVSKQYAHSCRIFDSLMQQSSVLSLHNLKRIARSVVMGLRSYEGERTSKLFFLCFSFSYVSTFSGGLINFPSMSDEFFHDDLLLSAQCVSILPQICLLF